MKNGTYIYCIQMKTPLGRRRGNLELMVEGEFLNGYLTMFTRTVPIKAGRIAEGKVSFSGDMRNPLKTLPYQAEGTVSASGVELIIETELGKYPASGEITQTRGV